MRRALCLVLALTAILLAGCGRAERDDAPGAGSVGSMALDYAENFAVDYYEGGAARLRVGEQEFLLLPESAAVPAGMEALPRISVPVKDVYLASSSVPDLFLQIGALDAARYTSTDASGWRIPELRDALEEERLFYVGKYSAPDYELLLTEGCGLAVENTMILHSPATKEKLEALGIPVLIEYSSYEPHPLGRVEWIKLYGLLTGKLPEAERFFDEQLAVFHAVENAEPSGKTVAFFHITPNSAVVVRRQADYVTRMIELAGAETAITELPEDENALSTVTIQMESFYAQARDADVLIYNSTVAGELESVGQLVALAPPLGDFKAVKTGDVWCTEMSMFQRSSAAAGVIADFREAVSGAADRRDLQYLHRMS